MTTQYFPRHLLRTGRRLRISGLLFFLGIQLFLRGQEIAAFPAEFNSLKDDKQKAIFLQRAINDSINEDLLTNVYAWSDAGMSYSKQAGLDSLNGYFLLYKGKAHYYHYYNNDSAIYFFKKSLPYFPDKANLQHITLVRDIMAAYSATGNKDSTFAYVDSTREIMDALPDTSRAKIKLAEVVGTVYSDFGLFKTAISYYQMAINGCLRNNNKRGLGMVLANLALVYEQLEDNKKEIEFSKEAAGYLADVKMPLATILSNIGSGYFNLSQVDSARFYLEKSDVIASELKMTSMLRANASILASIYTGEKNYNAARKLLDENLLYYKKVDDPPGLIKTLLYSGNLDTATHNFARAKQNLNNALAIARKIEYPLFQAMALQSLTSLARKTGDYKVALAYQTDLMIVKDSLTSDKARAQLSDLEVSYKTRQKEQQIQILQKDNNIKNLQLQNNRRSTIFYIICFGLLLTILGIVFYQRNLRNKMEMQKMKAELETKVLRSQMNPHFIFNSLNSIENFMMQNEKRQASDYLNKFSKLIRSILESSRNELVPLVKDVEALQLYVDLEQLRFHNKFSYQANVDPELVNGDYQVPSLLIQPYVENAIVHGMAHSDKAGLNLSVSAILEDGYIKYTMQDNGIGRKKSGEYNKYNKPQHKSVGLKITEDRIMMFNQAMGIAGYQPVITDLWDENGNSAGTKVEIKIKAA
ncbi:MAG: histidine kinase [Chitinophagaceae bacterium]